jgi:hypothetical protein
VSVDGMVLVHGRVDSSTCLTAENGWVDGRDSANGPIEHAAPAVWRTDLSKKESL